MGTRGFLIDHSGSSNYAARLPGNCKSLIVRQYKFYLTHAGRPQLPEIVNNSDTACYRIGGNVLVAKRANVGPFGVMRRVHRLVAEGGGRVAHQGRMIGEFHCEPTG